MTAASASRISASISLQWRKNRSRVGQIQPAGVALHEPCSQPLLKRGQMAAGGRVRKLQRLRRAGQAAEFGDLHENFDLGPTIHDASFPEKENTFPVVAFRPVAWNLKSQPKRDKGLPEERPARRRVRNLNEDNVTQAVIARHLNASDVRFREVMTALVQHLHAFAREVHLTEAEWLDGINFLTAVGHITDARRQEFILLSDTLGLSMLVTAQNKKKPPGCTESTVFGPFHVADAPQYDMATIFRTARPGCRLCAAGSGMSRGEAFPAPRSNLAGRRGRPLRRAVSRSRHASGARRAHARARRSLPFQIDRRRGLSDSA